MGTALTGPEPLAPSEKGGAWGAEFSSKVWEAAFKMTSKNPHCPRLPPSP